MASPQAGLYPWASQHSNLGGYYDFWQAVLHPLSKFSLKTSTGRVLMWYFFQMYHKVYVNPGMSEWDSLPQQRFIKWEEKATPRILPGPSTVSYLKARCPEQVSTLTRNSFWVSSTGFFLSNLSGRSDLYDSRGRKYWKVKVIKDETLNMYHSSLIFLYFTMLLHNIPCEIRWIRKK